MTPPMLSKGQNAPLPEDAKHIAVVLGWAEPNFEMAASALLLGADNKVRSDADFVFYNQPESSDGSVRFSGSTTGQGARARITVDLTSVPSDVHAIALAGSVTAGDFGALGELALDITDETGRPLARYATRDASTESAFVFGEIYRRGNGWKIRAIGQGWESGLAGLATDFGVSIDDSNEENAGSGGFGSKPSRQSSSAAPVGPAASIEHPRGSSYRLWGEARRWCDYELNLEKQYLPAVRSLFPANMSDDGSVLTPDVQLVPDPGGPHGPWSISVRAKGQTIGYLDPDNGPRWAGPIRRIIASGFVPTTAARIWANEYDGWDGPELRAGVQIALGEPTLAIPLNEPPAQPYTLLPRSAIMQVTKENEHFDVLRNHVPPNGHGLLFVTLVENVPTVGKAKAHVEVRIDDQRVGQLTPQMSQRYLPMIQHLRARGLTTACWGDIKGSAVAAKVRIDGIKANEATPAVLNGPPVTVARLCLANPDLNRYDLTLMRSLLTPVPPIPPTPTTIPKEPSDSSIVRFEKGGGRYHYIATRRGDSWETTATGDWGSIDEVMSWTNLAARVRTFRIATQWSPVAPRRDPQVRAHLAVVRFTIGDRYLAAINVCTDGRAEGNWYTTITDRAERTLPFGDYARWQDIAEHGSHIQLATGWSELT
ncbi:TerD family protein [Nocardia sp. NPDC023852]|uniref:TerD family protein n=1 Tax=Nocardia sp. NPDC023852 TaxID=3154697 RepID=UPI0033C4FF8B